MNYTGATRGSVARTSRGYIDYMKAMVTRQGMTALSL
jgi:hypothetical protein